MKLFRSLFQIFYDVRSILGGIQVKKHLRSRNELLRVREPFVEGIFGPNYTGSLERNRITIIGNCSRLSPEYTAMLGADIVGVERMTILTALVDLFTVYRTRRGPGAWNNDEYPDRDSGKQFCSAKHFEIRLNPPTTYL